MTAFMLNDTLYDNSYTTIHARDRDGIRKPASLVRNMCPNDSKLCVHPEYGECTFCFGIYNDYVQCCGQFTLENYRQGRDGLEPLTISQFGSSILWVCSNFPMTVGDPRKLFFDREGMIIVCNTEAAFMAALQDRIGIIRMKSGVGYFTKSELIEWLKIFATHWNSIDEYVAYRDANAIPELTD